MVEYHEDCARLRRAVGVGLGCMAASVVPAVLATAFPPGMLIAYLLSGVTNLLWCGVFGAWFHATRKLRGVVDEPVFRRAMIGSPERGRPWIFFVIGVVLLGMFLGQVKRVYGYRDLGGTAMSEHLREVSRRLDEANR